MNVQTAITYFEDQIDYQYKSSAYWQQKIVMKYSYQLKSLKLAWQLFQVAMENMAVWNQRKDQPIDFEITSDPYATARELGHKYMGD